MQSNSDHQKTVLVVDDEDIILNLTREIVSFLGYRCITASSGKEALEAIRSERPDLVLLDSYMPEMTGEHVLKTIRPEFPDLKVIVSSGKQLDDDEKIRFQDLKIKDFIYKPYEIAVMKDAIQRLVG